MGLGSNWFWVMKMSQFDHTWIHRKSIHRMRVVMMRMLDWTSSIQVRICGPRMMVLTGILLICSSCSGRCCCCMMTPTRVITRGGDAERMGVGMVWW
jgi:ribosomal protein L16/L10AE